MVWIAGGAFLRGSDQHYPEERPKRRVSVDGFWIDRTPVTNADFARFAEATGYRTMAERGPDAEDFFDAPPEHRVPGSMVFVPPRELVPMDQADLGWTFVPGADWRHPTGPDSSIAGIDRHPVVHVGLADAEAYCAWAGTSLPTEEEWEFAARGGITEAEYAWGDQLEPNGRRMANIWHGTFPHLDDGGHVGTSAVGSYPANGFELYDMIGNVWEWTADWWAIHPLASAAPDDPRRVPRRVLKGGSYLCAPNHSRRYRPAARQPQPIDLSTSHIGMRCVMRPSDMASEGEA